MIAAEFAKLVRHAKRRPDGKWWDAQCGAHDDRHASLSFADGDHALVVACHAGCSREQIAAAVGRTVADFSHPENGRRAPSRRIIATYDYRSAAGELLYQVVRFEPKDFRCRRPDGDGGWRWNLDSVSLVPYRLPELAEAPRVFVPEGERDVDTLVSLGLVATCNHGGAGKWRQEHTRTLVAAAVPEVIVLRDNDRAGAAHQDAIVQSCAAAGLQIKRVILSGLPPLRDKHGEDVTDWLAAGHTKEELLTLADEAPMFEAGKITEDADGPVLVRLDAVAAEPVEWSWERRAARGKLTLIIGEPGAGKTRVTHDVIARHTRGLPWPDGGQAPQGPCLLMACEDGLADTVRPSIERQGGDPAHVHVLRAVRIEGYDVPVSLDRDLAALDRVLSETRAVALVVDPLSAYLGTKDSYRDAEIRGILDPIAALAERYRVSVVGILHLTKAQQRKLLNRAQGSIAFVAVARIVLAVGEDPEQPGRRLLASVKNNLGPDAPALAFQITDRGLMWDARPIEGNADRLLAIDEPVTRTEQREREDAKAFLRDVLANGAMASKRIEGDAKANGISQRTLWRAKAELGIAAERSRTVDGNTGPWYWLLPVSS